MNITTIIRNRNEQDYIGFAIQSVIDHLPDSKLIVVDNKSTDESMEVVQMFNDRIDTHTIEVDNYTPGLALNSAIDQTYTDYVLVLSAHSQITHLDFNKLISNFENNVAVFGKQVPIYRGKKITPRYIWSHFGDDEVTNMYSQIEQRRFLHNAFCFYRTDLFKEIEFDETLSGKEDRYFANDIVDLDKNYLYDPSFQCNHFWTPNGNTWKGIGAIIPFIAPLVGAFSVL